MFSIDGMQFWNFLEKLFYKIHQFMAGILYSYLKLTFHFFLIFLFLIDILMSIIRNNM